MDQAIEYNRVQSKLPLVSPIKASFPLYLAKINYSRNGAHVEIPDYVGRPIFDAVQDSNEAYLNTLQLQDSGQTFYVILYDFFPGMLNARLMCFNDSTGQFYKQTADFSLSAMYELESGLPKPSNLKKLFKLSTPELDITYINGVRCLKLTRLYHNGTSNAIETTALKWSAGKVDTLYFNRDWIR